MLMNLWYLRSDCNFWVPKDHPTFPNLRFAYVLRPLAGGSIFLGLRQYLLSHHVIFRHLPSERLTNRRTFFPAFYHTYGYFFQSGEASDLDAVYITSALDSPVACILPPVTPIRLSLFPYFLLILRKIEHPFCTVPAFSFFKSQQVAVRSGLSLAHPFSPGALGQSQWCFLSRWTSCVHAVQERRLLSSSDHLQFPPRLFCSSFQNLQSSA